MAKEPPDSALIIQRNTFPCPRPIVINGASAILNFLLKQSKMYNLLLIRPACVISRPPCTVKPLLHGQTHFLMRLPHTCPNKIFFGLIQPIPHAFLMDEGSRSVRQQTSPSSGATRRIPQVDSPPPHRPGCFGVASRLLLRSRPTTPHPCGAKATLLAKLTCLRRTFSRATRANPSIVHRTSNIVHRQSPRGCLGPSSVFTLRAAHPRCPYALTAVVRVVHPTSYIGGILLPKAQ